MTEAMNPVLDYIARTDPKIQNRLTTLRQIFFDILPDTEESIRYQMPAFTVGSDYLYFAAYKKHIGFYPVYGLDEIENEIVSYRAKTTKDSLHFMHDQPLPIDLIKKIIILKSKK